MGEKTVLALTGSQWRDNQRCRVVVVMGTTAGDHLDPMRGGSRWGYEDETLYVHYRDREGGPMRTISRSGWEETHGGVKRFTPLSGDPVCTTGTAALYRAAPLPERLERDALGTSPVRGRLAALKAVENLRKLMTGNASAESVAYTLGVVGGFRLAGLLNPEDARLILSEIGTCPGHEPGASWCSFCGLITHSPEEGCDHD